MEASALRAPALSRRPLATPLLRLRSDDQLIALFRAGSDDAFSIIHDRYRQRLFAYVRQMLSAGPRADAEDVLQDVFVRAYGALRADTRDVNLRAWLYRVAHNRCIDHLRRPTPPASEIFELSRTPLQDPIETAQRRDDLRRLVTDVGRLPEQQRSALLMREIDGLAYAHIAEALDVTVPAVKSLLVRARMGLVEAIEARETDCDLIRTDLLDAYDRGVKASGRARRHMRECTGCCEYRTALRGMRRSFAALSPIGALGPIAMLAKAVGLGGASGGGGAAAAGVGGASAVVGTCKVAAVVCTAALATGTAAVEVKHRFVDKPSQRTVAAAAPVVAAASAPAVAGSSVLHPRVDRIVAAPRTPAPERKAPAAAKDEAAVVETLPAAVAPVVADPGVSADTTPAAKGTGGSSAPVDDEAVAAPAPKEEVAAPTVPTTPTTPAPQTPATADPTTAGGTPPSNGGPPPEH